MKVFIILLAFVSVSFGYPIPRTWTFYELAIEATEEGNLHQPSPEKATLLHALDVMVTKLFRNQEYVNAFLLSPTGEKMWTIRQLEKVLNDRNTNKYHFEFIAPAYAVLRRYNGANKGKEKDTTEVLVLALDISTWTKDEISKALKDPSIKPDLVPYLREAQKELDQPDASGKKKDNEAIITPVGLVPLPEGVVPIIVKSKSTV